MDMRNAPPRPAYACASMLAAFVAALARPDRSHVSERTLCGVVTLCVYVADSASPSGVSYAAGFPDCAEARAAMNRAGCTSMVGPQRGEVPG